MRKAFLVSLCLGGERIASAAVAAPFDRGFGIKGKAHQQNGTVRGYALEDSNSRAASALESPNPESLIPYTSPLDFNLVAGLRYAPAPPDFEPQRGDLS